MSLSPASTISYSSQALETLIPPCATPACPRLSSLGLCPYLPWVLGRCGWAVPGSWWLPRCVSGVVQVRESHIRGRAREGIASACLVLDSLTPLPTSALKNREILQFSTSTPNLFLENKANAPAVFCEDALLVPQPWQQIYSHCQSEVVGAVGDLP